MLVALLALCSGAAGQERVRPLPYFIEAAKRNSPFINECRNRLQIGQAELHRLEAMHRRSRVEANGEWLVVPVVAVDGGRTTFEWQAGDGGSYWGYDVGESSGHLHAGLTWTQPLLGGYACKAAKAQADVSAAVALHDLRMEEHQLERTVTEHYLICCLDLTRAAYADSIAAVIARQAEVVGRLVAGGLVKQSDLSLLAVERAANEEQRLAALQSYAAHLADLHVLCGLGDTADVRLAAADLQMRPWHGGTGSLFAEQFTLDSIAAEAYLRASDVQRRPRLELFANAGLQTGSHAGWYRHFGWNAGMAFAWTIHDGRQRKWERRQARLRQMTAAAYRDNALLQRDTRLRQCLDELRRCDERADALRAEVDGYDGVLRAYAKEMRAGQVSVLDYITVLRDKMQVERELQLLLTNRQMLIAAYNYWNE